VDGGANIGLFTILMKNQYPDAKIICIEPDSENFDILQKNVSLYSNVYCEKCGLWNKDTKLKVYDKYNLGKWGLVVEEDLDNGNLPAISIESLLKKHNIEQVDILKLDIEGSEKEIFSDNFEIWLQKVKIIVVELHDRMKAGCAKAFFEAINKNFTNYTLSISSGGNIIIAKID
jgi:FkbM family methyltransferase